MARSTYTGTVKSRSELRLLERKKKCRALILRRQFVLYFRTDLRLGYFCRPLCSDCLHKCMCVRARARSYVDGTLALFSLRYGERRRLTSRASRQNLAHTIMASVVRPKQRIWETLWMFSSRETYWVGWIKKNQTARFTKDMHNSTDTHDHTNIRTAYMSARQKRYTCLWYLFTTLKINCKRLQQVTSKWNKSLNLFSFIHPIWLSSV